MLTFIRNALRGDDAETTEVVDTEAVTIVRMVEIIREHGEGLVEILATVPFSERDSTFETWCSIARKRDLPGRISYRDVEPA